LPQHRPEVIGGWFRLVVLRVVTPQRHAAVIQVERLLDACRRDRREALPNQPPSEFHDGPRTSTVINIVIQSNDNASGLE
jgi:hypothetical protein